MEAQEFKKFNLGFNHPLPPLGGSQSRPGNGQLASLFEGGTECGELVGQVGAALSILPTQPEGVSVQGPKIHFDKDNASLANVDPRVAMAR